MADVIKVSSENNDDLGILTYRGLACEQSEGIPLNWTRFFIERSSRGEYIDYNRIYYLRNVNIRPYLADNLLSPALPIWHAAVILLDDDTPTRLLLVSRAEILDNLVIRFPPIPLIRRIYQEEEVEEIRVELDDLEEEPEYQKSAQLSKHHISVVRGWPTEEWQQQYQQAVEQMQQAIANTGGVVSAEVNYRMTTDRVELALRFECFIDFTAQAMLIQNDEVNSEETW